jgi:hypothetical protein
MRNNRAFEGGQLNEYCWEQDQGGHFKNKITMTPARSSKDTRCPTFGSRTRDAIGSCRSNSPGQKYNLYGVSGA